MTNSIKEQLASTPLFGSNANAVERLYEQYLDDPDQVPAGWREYFASLGEPDTEVVHSRIREELLVEAATGRRAATTTRSRGKAATAGEKQAAAE